MAKAVCASTCRHWRRGLSRDTARCAWALPVARRPSRLGLGPVVARSLAQYDKLALPWPSVIYKPQLSKAKRVRPWLPGRRR